MAGQEAQGWACLLSCVTLGCLVASLVSGAWISTEKVVVYTDADTDTSLEVYARFSYSLLSTKQAIWTESGKVLYLQRAYQWCGQQGSHSEAYYCLLLTVMQHAMLVALLLGPLIIITLGTGALGNIKRSHARVVGLVATLAVLAQLLAQGALLYGWYRLYNDLNSDFDNDFPIIHGLSLSLDRAWYLGAGGGFATFLAFLMCSPYLVVTCCCCCCYPSPTTLKGSYHDHDHGDQEDEEDCRLEKPWEKEREKFFLQQQQPQ